MVAACNLTCTDVIVGFKKFGSDTLLAEMIQSPASLASVGHVRK